MKPGDPKRLDKKQRSFNKLTSLHLFTVYILTIYLLYNLPKLYLLTALDLQPWIISKYLEIKTSACCIILLFSESLKNIHGERGWRVFVFREFQGYQSGKISSSLIT